MNIGIFFSLSLLLLTTVLGGKDAASARYIFTKLSPLIHMLFPREDDPILNHRIDDGQKVEPVYYVPILPMVLVNGTEGIGTGWSTNVLKYNPVDLIKCIQNKLEGKSYIGLVPWTRGFQGKMYPGDNEDYTKEELANRAIKKWTSRGCWVEEKKNSIRITELPLGKWTEDYKQYLNDLMTRGEIRGIEEYHTEKNVDFLIHLSVAQKEALEKAGIEQR